MILADRERSISDPVATRTASPSAQLSLIAIGISELDIPVARRDVTGRSLSYNTILLRFLTQL